MYTVEQAVQKMLEANSGMRRIDSKEIEAFLCNNGVILFIQTDNGVEVYSIKGKRKYKFTITSMEEKNE